MSYQVRIARQAERYLQRLPRPIQERMLRRLQQIAEDPYGPHTKPLEGLSGRRAARVGGWRIIFAVDDEARRVDVSDIGPRGDVYGHM
ncbi:MAG: type II toxin-antitoxin system RelE/ParE family toxin [Chloroflexi bacterium]|nr:type II toxin-antitoxin system RelE/ParE family toxin [Chloroflexota bacterium]